jgi:hypothetical protein
MNAKHDTRPTVAAIHAEESGVAAYRIARQHGASPEQAMRAHSAAYAAAIAQG